MLHRIYRNNLESILSLLDCVSLIALEEVVKTQKTGKHLSEFIMVYRFVRRRMQSIDRSLYVTMPISKQQWSLVVLERSHTLQSEGHIKIVKELQLGNVQIKQFLASSCGLNENQIDTLEEIFVNPDLPLPPLLRSSITEFTNSLYQALLRTQAISQKWQHFGEEVELKDYFEENYQTYIVALKSLNIDFSDEDQENQIEKITTLGTWESNYTRQTIQGNELHNFLVSIFALLKNHVNSVSIYLQAIKDKAQRSAQLSLRYIAYRHMVLAIEDKYSFAFELEEQLLQQIFGKQLSMPSTFLQSSLMFWKTKMAPYYHQANLLVCKAYEKSRNLFHLDTINSFSHNFDSISEIYQMSQIHATLEKFFQQDQLLPNQHNSFLAQTDIETEETHKTSMIEESQLQTSQHLISLIDLSIDSQSAKWLGHSEPVITGLYSQFEEEFLLSACKYYSTVHTIINQSNISKPIKAKLFEKLVCSETDKMERYCIAPQTIKIFIGFAKQIGDIKKRADEFCNLSQRDIIVERNCHKQVQKQVIQPCLQIPAQMRLNLQIKAK